MMRLTPLLTALSVLLAVHAPAYAINKDAGTSAAQFLKLGAGSRAGAMAEAYSAIADDLYSVYYNPAGLTHLTKSELGASHTELFQDINYDFAGFVYPWGTAEGHSKHALGVSIYTLGISGIERRANDTTDPTGNFTAGDNSYNISYGRWLNKSVSLGVTGKLVSQKIDAYKSDAGAIDLGLQYQPRPEMARPLALSLVIRNLGSRVKFAGESDPLPMAVVGGVGYGVIPQKLKVGIDVTKYRDTNAFIATGGEYSHQFDDNMGAAVRMGFSTHRVDNEGFTEATAGAGLRFHRASFDFSWIPFGALGNTFRYSFQLQF